MQIEQSAKGRVWKIAEIDRNTTAFLNDAFDLTILSARILTARAKEICGSLDKDFLDLFLKGNIQALLESVDLMTILPDIDKTLLRIKQAIDNNEKIGIFGDYDVDGLSATALLFDFFQELGAECVVWIPARADGYGLSEQGLEYLKEQDASLLFSVDCGSSNEQLLQKFKEQNPKTDFIVIDHHKVEQNNKLHEIIHSFVNPHRANWQQKEMFDTKNLCAAGLSYLVVACFLRKYGDAGNNILKKLAIYAALGSVCDIMPITNLFNRMIIKAGLEGLNIKTHRGLQALIENLDIKRELKASHLGFSIGPHLNASARMDSAHHAFQLLTSRCPLQVASYAQVLQTLNAKRKATEKDILEQARAQAASQKHKNSIVVYGENWHVGVIGIIAARLKDEFFKPVVVLSMDTECKGSARSVEGIDIGFIFQQALAKGLLLSGGGHKMAAGLALSSDRLEDFSAFFEKCVGRIVAKEKDTLLPVTYVDCYISLSHLHEVVDIGSDIGSLSPFGSGYNPPVVCVPGLNIAQFSVRKQHVYVTVEEGNLRKGFWAFFAADRPLGCALREKLGSATDLLLQINDDGLINIIDAK